MNLSKTELFFRSCLQHYNEKRYWKYRARAMTGKGRFDLRGIYCLWRVKRSDAFNNASLGTHLGFGASFAEKPRLPHGLNGIVISHNAVIGKKCVIFHQVTVGEGRGGAPTIGDNVLLGAGCKVIGGITIGNNARIAAGCVVMEDIPENAVVLPAKNQIIIKERGEKNES